MSALDSCEYIGCKSDGWVCLHFGPNLTPPLRLACLKHKTETDLDMFEDRIGDDPTSPLPPAVGDDDA